MRLEDKKKIEHHKTYNKTVMNKQNTHKKLPIVSPGLVTNLPQVSLFSPGDEKKRKALETRFNLPWIELSNITINTTYLIRRSFCSSVSSFSFLPSPVN